MTELKSVVHCGGNGFFVGISPGGHSLVIETDGGRASAPTPIELLLVAVGSCMGSDVIEILRKKRERVTDYHIDIRGMRRAEFPRRFEAIHLHHVVTGLRISRQAVEQAVQLADEKYCSVAATLRPSASVTTSFEVLEPSVPICAAAEVEPQ